MHPTSPKDNSPKFGVASSPQARRQALGHGMVASLRRPNAATYSVSQCSWATSGLPRLSKNEKGATTPTILHKAADQPEVQYHCITLYVSCGQVIQGGENPVVR